MKNSRLPAIFSRLRISRGFAFGIIIITALFAFEIFNYSTTEFALSDLLGDLHFVGLRWATILAIAFCGIDFAGIARLFTPEQGIDEPAEVWYLFAAWLLAATMNAMLTWWGVSLAILNHPAAGNALITRGTFLTVVPILVAIMVWLIRVLIIGTFSVAGERLFSQAERVPRMRPADTQRPTTMSREGQVNGYSRIEAPTTTSATSFRPMPRQTSPAMSRGNSVYRGTTTASPEMPQNRPEVTYHPLPMYSRPAADLKLSRK